LNKLKYRPHRELPNRTGSKGIFAVEGDLDLIEVRLPTVLAQVVLRLEDVQCRSLELRLFDPGSVQFVTPVIIGQDRNSGPESR